MSLGQVALTFHDPPDSFFLWLRKNLAQVYFLIHMSLGQDFYFLKFKQKGL